MTDPAWNLANGTNNTAIFNTADATPTVSDTVYINDLRFSNTTSIAGSGLIVSRNYIYAVSNATINANHSRSSGAGGTLNVYGPGTLTFGGASVVNGQFVLNSGEMVIGASCATRTLTSQP